MTGTVTLSDGGQNYIEFDIVDNLVTEVRPTRLEGWKDTKIKSLIFEVGGRLAIELHNGYRFALKYPIVEIQHIV